MNVVHANPGFSRLQVRANLRVVAHGAIVELQDLDAEPDRLTIARGSRQPCCSTQSAKTWLASDELAGPISSGNWMRTCATARRPSPRGSSAVPLSSHDLKRPGALPLGTSPPRRSRQGGGAPDRRPGLDTKYLRVCGACGWFGGDSLAPNAMPCLAAISTRLRCSLPRARPECRAMPRRARGARLGHSGQPGSTSRFFSTLGVAPILARVPRRQGSPGRGRYRRLLSHDVWHSLYGADPGGLGRSLRMDNTEYEVIGVMPPGLRFPGGAEAWGTLQNRCTKELERNHKTYDHDGNAGHGDGIAGSPAIT